MTVLLAKRGFTSPGSRFLRDMERLGATDAWDFVNQSYLRAGRVTASGITFTRASVGSYLNSNNTMTVFSSGQPRIGDKGLLVEGSRQNLFLNSAVGATQSITVTAAAHTLSFYGTGTVTLSGVSTDGPLVGTGEFDRVSLTFTPTAGSLTLTVSGDIKWVNLELGSFPTSWIPSDGTAVTRAADVATAVPSAGTDYPLTLFAEFERAIDTGANETIVSVHAAATNQFRMLIETADRPRTIVASGGSGQADLIISQVIPIKTPQKIASRCGNNDVRLVFETTLSAADTSVTVPSTPTTVSFGVSAAQDLPSFGYLRRIAIFLRLFTNVELQEITT